MRSALRAAAPDQGGQAVQDAVQAEAEGLVAPARVAMAAATTAG
ncbi:hypothetical protein [Kitasatospora sp. NPDC086791]